MTLIRLIGINSLAVFNVGFVSVAFQAVFFVSLPLLCCLCRVSSQRFKYVVNSMLVHMGFWTPCFYTLVLALSMSFLRPYKVRLSFVMPRTNQWETSKKWTSQPGRKGEGT